MIEIIPNWHPIFVHYTIALLSISAVLFLTGRVLNKGVLITVARWNLWLGALITIGTVSAGLIASSTVAHDAESHAAMMNHRNWALGTAFVFLLLAFWAYIRREEEKPSILFLLTLLLAAGALATTGYKGGELVYRHGTGVMSLPDTSVHDHAHMESPARNTDYHDTAPGAEQKDSGHDHSTHAH